MNSPLVSIIIPFFNKADLLLQMVDSIKNQTYKNWELFLVDDGSTTEVVNTLFSHIQYEKRIHYIKRNRLPKNGDTCRNIGLSYAKGKYVLFFDADDLISKTCLEYRVKYMENNVDCDYASFPYETFYNGNFPNEKQKNRKHAQPSNKTLLKQLLRNDYPFTVWSNIYKRESLKTIKWDENVYVYQDFDFMIQCVCRGLRFQYANTLECDYFYRLFLNGNNVSSNFTDEKKCHSTIYLFNKVYSQLGNYPNSSHFRKVFKEYFIIHFYRLLLSNNDNEIRNFIKHTETYYGVCFTKRLNKVYYEWKVNNNLVKLYFNLAKEFGYKRHLNYWIHCIAKQFLHKPIQPYK